ncbi:MAG: alpha/beta hydrolase, partial [Gammaproteobacteria bacterium]|nr:alpha/beta hydrolase [Gammaproteobacteria bacterium]
KCLYTLRILLIIIVAEIIVYRMKQNNHQKQRQLQSLHVRLLRLLISGPGRWMPSLACYWVWRFWTSTYRFTAPAREITWRKQAKQSFIKQPGSHEQKICVYQWGEGPVILLVHGWNGRATQLAASVDGLVAAGYKVIGFDAPGHGQSDGNQTHIIEVCEIMAELNELYGPVHGIIAHSFGVPCSVLALNESIKPEKIVCISSPLSVHWLLDKFCEHLECPASVKQAIERKMKKQFGKDIWPRLKTDELAKTLTCPALIIHDRNDSNIPWEHGQTLSDHWPDSRLLLTDRLGHRRILHNPTVIKQIVTFFSD